MIDLKFIEEKAKKLIEDIEPIEYSYIQENLSSDKKEIKECFIYLVSEDIYNEFLLLEQSARSILNLDSNSRVKALYSIVNLVNTGKPIYKYNQEIKLLKKYQLITDQEKCFNRLNAEFRIQQNMEKLKFNNFIKNYVDDEDERNLKILEFENRMSKLEETIEYINKNRDNYEVIISNYKKELLYPHLYGNYYVDRDKEKTKGRDFYLRETIPNILLYTPDPAKDINYKDNEVVRKFIDNADHLIGPIYFKEVA